MTLSGSGRRYFAVSLRISRSEISQPEKAVTTTGGGAIGVPSTNIRKSMPGTVVSSSPFCSGTGERSGQLTSWSAATPRRDALIFILPVRSFFSLLKFAAISRTLPLSCL
ncbi:MAG: hypothetical protein BWY71_02360 [Planctomycetes bacterium ADurb.Bin412]|nr:MAG: hypothetical protein BWY71_02360 [Planctomycetes bacterium ADurb.Bin412]